MPNWAEQVTAIATAISAIGLLSAIGAVIFASQQAHEARIGRQAETAVEFFRRWSEDPMVETRRLVAQFETPEALRDATNWGSSPRTPPRRTSCTGNSTTSSNSVPSRGTAASTSSSSEPCSAAG